ncbi:MAG: hypothetical protein NC253_03000 [Ruminococcus sp.]|nr:hypothetical protein [Ruminococcus sp.]MCM1380363.1 hypothetical protein [Muribaculaceae bacterium]MCM1478327.1 hypothetical protein [Muribaculaceae bacterium]
MSREVLNEEVTYDGRVCLSKEETWEAWKLECIKDKTRTAVAMELFVSEKTLHRMYRRYGFPPPKSKEGKRYAESLSVLQGCAPDRICMPEKAVGEKTE